MLSRAPEPLSAAREVDEDGMHPFSWIKIATRLAVLVIGTVTLIACTVMVILRDRSESTTVNGDTGDLPQVFEINEVTAPGWVLPTAQEPLIAVRTNVTKKECQTRECVYARWLINISVDKTKNPCDNFYKYVCSGVMKKYPDWFIDSEGIRIDMYLTMTRNNTKLVFQHLNTTWFPAARQTAHQKAAAFFRECQAIGPTPQDLSYLLAFIRSHQLWTPGEPPFDPLDLLIKFMVKIHLPFLFTLEAPMNRQRGKPVISMRRSKDFTDWLAKRPRPIQYVSYMATVENVLTRVRVMRSENPDRELVRKVIMHENKVVKLSRRAFPDGDLLEVLPLRMLGQWRNERNLTRGWIRHLQMYTGGRLPKSSVVWIKLRDIEFFHDLFGHPGAVSRHELKTFISWSVTRILSQLISVFEPAPADACSQHILTFFGNAAAYPLYATVNEARIYEVKHITNIILQEAIKSMNKTSWMDESTRKEAMQKLRVMKRFFAYPIAVSRRQGLDDYYADIPDVRGPFLKDYLNAAETYASHNVRKMSSPTRVELERTTFPLSTISANGGYLKAVNAMYITAGLMLPPAFTLGGPPEVNFGGIGRAIAHEMMHAFNPDVRYFDARGQIRNWWTTRSDRAYRARVKCHNDSVKRAPAMRRSSLEDEYLSDMMGERSLFKAYKRVSRTASVTLGSAGNLTADQIFYVIGCLGQCGGSELQHTYPPAHHRCNVPLMNTPHFARAFSCPEESPMNPRKKCAFW